MSLVDHVKRLTPAERHLVDSINKHWTREHALSELKSHLQVAIEVELATIPIYLFTYYSINRTPSGFPDTALAQFADRAGATIMSVAVEEMLHMSLSSNVLFSLGQMPQLYLNSPGPYPTNLPGHTKLGPDAKPLSLPLSKLSTEQLWHFLEIEYPAASDAPAEGAAWKTIGQIYSYVRCIICSDHIKDEDFHQGAKLHQIQPTNYSPNNIDTVYPEHGFNKSQPPAGKDSAAHAAAYMSRGDSHAGKSQLLAINSREDALQAIQTIDAQGEGFGPTKFDDPSHQELSHYFKFLTLQSQMEGYDPKSEKLPKHPHPPAAAKQPISSADVSQVVWNFPDNPVASSYPTGYAELANVVSGLYQYMLIMTESIFLQEPHNQKRYFNQSLHRSMIWILDKVIQQMATISVQLNNVSYAMAPTFENINLGHRHQAFNNLSSLANNFRAQFGQESWYVNAYLDEYIAMIPTLPDVSQFWPDVAKPALEKFLGVPKFPASPPGAVGKNEARHACMGLNSCKGQGRTRDNNCAGQGYCSTALEYNYADPSQPKVSDHTCHVKNDCAGQGGCGLYGTAEEQNHPSGNDCATLGSCATPINAERFSTDGPNRGKSVWKRARKVFEEKTWPSLREQNPSLPKEPPAVPHAELFSNGPTMEWIETYSGEGMTACGASGMSGANSCG